MPSTSRGPRLRPFRAWRYRVGTDLDAVIAPPYDVLSSEDADALRARDPHQIVHVDLPVAPPGEDRYAAAARLLRAWQDDGVLVRDPRPSVTVYRMTFRDATGRDRALVGVLGGLEVVDEGAGRVLPHERTTPKASTDRLDLTRATQANLSPVWGLAVGAGLTDALAEPGEELGVVHAEGVEHAVERVEEPARIAAIAEVVGAADVLIADGHHRYGVARAYRDEVRARTGRTDTAAEDTLAFVGELVADQLAIEAIHRIVRGIPLEALQHALARDFELVPGAGPARASLLAELRARGRLALLTPDGEATWLVPRESAFAGVRELDGALLEHTLAGTGALVDYQHGVDQVRAELARGEATAAVLIRPTSLAEIQRTAAEGLLMPPKSTFFTPKLRTGLVLRGLDEPA